MGRPGPRPGAGPEDPRDEPRGREIATVRAMADYDAIVIGAGHNEREVRH